jgi:hypothetical protein
MADNLIDANKSNSEIHNFLRSQSTWHALREFTGKEYPLSKFTLPVCLEYMGVKSSMGAYDLAGQAAEIYGSGSIEIAMFCKTSVSSLTKLGISAFDTCTVMSEVTVVHAKVIPEMKKIPSYVIICFFSHNGADIIGCNCECPAGGSFTSGCKHVGAVMHLLLRLIVNPKTGYLEKITGTGEPCGWLVPRIVPHKGVRSDKIELKRYDHLVVGGQHRQHRTARAIKKTTGENTHKKAAAQKLPEPERVKASAISCLARDLANIYMTKSEPNPAFCIYENEARVHSPPTVALIETMQSAAPVSPSQQNIGIERPSLPLPTSRSFIFPGTRNILILYFSLFLGHNETIHNFQMMFLIVPGHFLKLTLTKRERTPSILR